MWKRLSDWLCRVSNGWVALSSLIVFLMFAWPFVDARIRRHRPGSEASVLIGILGAIAIIALTVWEAVVEH